MLTASKQRRPKICSASECVVKDDESGRYLELENTMGDRIAHRTCFEMVARFFRLGKDLRLTVRKLDIKRSLVKLSVARWPESQFLTLDLFWPISTKSSTSSKEKKIPTLKDIILKGFDNTFRNPAGEGKKDRKSTATEEIWTETDEESFSDNSDVDDLKKKASPVIINHRHYHHRVTFWLQLSRSSCHHHYLLVHQHHHH